MPYANINSKSLFYTLSASATSTPKPSPLTLVFIHGLGSSSSFYSPVIPNLTGLGYRCLTLDTYGSGSSPYTDRGNSIASIALDVRALLDFLNITENVVLVGHSMGGIVASYLAADRSADNPKLFKAVVLIGPVNPNPGTAEVFGKRIGIVEKEGMEPLAVSIPTAATGTRSTPLVHAFIRSLLLGITPAGYISLCRAIMEAPVPQYSNIEIPLLAIAGKEDMSASLDGIEHIMREYKSPKKVLRVLEGVGHWHVLEAYSQVQDAIVFFLKDF